MRERTKKTIFNRLVACLLSFALVFCNTPIVPVQAATVTDETGWKYEVLSNGTAAIKGYTGTDAQIVIPTTVGGYQVSTIGERAFQKSTVSSVTIPEGITAIDSFAFGDCTVLTTVTMPSVIKIGNSSFQGCTSLTTINLENVTSIGVTAFRGCSALSEVNLGKLVSAGSQAFLDCTGLTKVTLGNLRNIESEMFENCSVLTSINLENVFNIKEEAFIGCAALKAAALNSVISIEEAAFSGCKALKNISFTETCTTIGISAFLNCKSLVNVVLPKSVTTIGESAFENCEGLETIVLPEELKTVSKSVFEGCISLKAITLPDTVTTLGDRAFYNCTALANVVFSDNMTAMGIDAFYKCIGLVTIELPKNLSVIKSGAFRECTSLETVALPSGLTAIESSAFYNCKSLENITFPAGLSSIGTNAFENCESLKTLIIPDAVTTIDSAVFSGCSGLSNIVLPKELTTINWEGLAGCTGLIDIILPATLNSFDSPFYGNSGKTIYYCVENSPAHTFLVGNKYQYNYYSTIVPGETTALTTPTKPGYEFQGWYTQKTGGDLVSDVTAFTEETVVYAHWKKILSETEMNLSLSEDTYTYNGMANVPEVTMQYGNTTMVKDKDYTVTIENNTNAGTATVTVTGIGGYTGTLTKTFTINTQSINRAEVTFDPYSYTYDDTEKIPAVKVVVNGRVLEKDKDYTIEYLNTVKAGYPTIALVGIGNYSGNYKASYEINKKSIEDATLTLSQTVYAYDGLDKEPEVVLKVGTVTLVKDTDYTVRYSNQSMAGIATVTVTGIGNYTGTLKREYEIIDYSIRNTQVIVNDLGYIYDGTDKLPEVKVGFKQAYLEQDVDYSVTYENNKNAGTATVTVTGIGKWKDRVSKTFNIAAADLSGATVSLSQAEYVYDGTEQLPTVSVVVGTTTLKQDVDYEVRYNNQTEVGEATVLISGIGNYYGSVSKTYQIKTASLEGFVINMVSTKFNYDGSEKTPVVSVGVLDAENTFEAVLEKGKDYKVSYSNHVNIGTATVTVTGIGNYSGTLTKEFEIQPIDIAAANISVLDADCMYDGEAKLPEVIVAYQDILLIKDVDYTLTYAANINPGTGTVTVTGIGNYVGTKTCEFVIKTIDIKAATLTLQTLEYVYDGTEKQPEVTVMLGETVLVKGNDYTVSYTDAVNAGTATVNVTGMGLYSGVVSMPYQIQAISISPVNVVLESTNYIYDGKLKTPDLIVTLGEKTLLKDVDYTLTYSNNLNVGTATISIAGIGNYKDVLTKEFNIEAINVTQTEVVLNASEFIYDGTEKIADVLVTYKDAILVKDVDYTLTYANNTNAGTASITVTGMGNYTGTKVSEFSIQSMNIETAVMNVNPLEFIYDGAEKYPEVAVVLGEKILVKDSDYTVAYNSNQNAGTATVTVTGIGNYTGSITKEFRIQPYDIETAVLNVNPTEFVYDGTERNPVVTVMVGETVLEEGTDYEVTFTDVVNAGTATVTVTGIGNYTGTQSKTFAINAASITGAKLTLQTTSYVYDGSEKKPAVTVVLGNKTLVKDVDYLVAYTNNKKAGTATVTITGIGNYTGSKSQSFLINVAKVANVKQSTQYSTSQIQLTWNKVSGATGYAVYYASSKNGTYKLAKTTTTNSYTNMKLKSATKRYYKVRAYMTVSGKKVYGEYSDVKCMVTKSGTPTGFTVSLSGKTAKIKWSKVSGTEGYEIYMSNSRSGKYTTIKSASASTVAYNKSGLVKGKKYYFKMRSYIKTETGAKVYSGYSKIKVVEVK